MRFLRFYLHTCLATILTRFAHCLSILHVIVGLYTQCLGITGQSAFWTMVPVRNTHSIKGRPLGMRLLDLAIVKGLHGSSNKNRRLLYSAPFRHHGPNNQTRIQMHARTLALFRIWNCTKPASVTPVVTSNQNSFLHTLECISGIRAFF